MMMIRNQQMIAMTNDQDYKYTNPHLGWTAYATDQISDRQLQTIDILYQPIIGMVATNLIHYFWHHLELVDHSYDQTAHANLIHFLQINQQQLYQARLKLEGVGLLKTFLQKTESKPLVIYQLMLPMTPRQFFQDDLLTTALLENVGEDEYQKLNHKMVTPPLKMMDRAVDITHDFLSVFRINRDDLIHQPAAVTDVKTRSNVKANHTALDSDPNKFDNHFDMHFLLDILDRTYVKGTQIKKYQSLILQLNQMFGIDETQMSRLIMRATNVNNNVFNPKKLRLLVHRQFHELNQQTTPQPEFSNTDQDRFQGLSEENQQLIKAADHYAPIDFANVIKKYKDANSFLTDDETYAIEDLVNRHSMSTGAINILIYHILNDLEHTNLSAKIMDRIANTWLQTYHVKNATDAIHAVQQYNQDLDQGKKDRARQYGGYRNQKTIDKKLPNWMKEKYDPEKDKLSEKNKQEVQRLLEEFEKGRD